VITAPLRVAVVGPGDIATKAYLPVLARRDDVELILMSRTPERVARVAREFRIPRTTTRLADLLDGRVDAAFVHAATEAHADLVAALLSAGVHVLVDKPLAPSLAEARRLVELAERHERSLVVGFNRRYAPPYAALTRLPRSVVLIQKHRAGLPDDPRRVVFDDFVHVVDTLRFLLPGVEERVDVRCVVRDGLLHTVTLGLHTTSATGLGVMHRTSGAAEEVVEVLGEGHKHRVVDLALVERHTGGELRLERRGDWAPVPVQRGFAAMSDAFLGAVREGRVLSARDALRTHEICEDVVRAAESGQPLETGSPGAPTAPASAGRRTRPGGTSSA
jgi:virulence factor